MQKHWITAACRIIDKQTRINVANSEFCTKQIIKNFETNDRSNSVFRTLVQAPVVILKVIL